MSAHHKLHDRSIEAAHRRLHCRVRKQKLALQRGGRAVRLWVPAWLWRPASSVPGLRWLLTETSLVCPTCDGSRFVAAFYWDPETGTGSYSRKTINGCLRCGMYGRVRRSGLRIDGSGERRR